MKQSEIKVGEQYAVIPPRVYLNRQEREFRRIPVGLPRAEVLEVGVEFRRTSSDPWSQRQIASKSGIRVKFLDGLVSARGHSEPVSEMTFQSGREAYMPWEKYAKLEAERKAELQSRADDRERRQERVEALGGRLDTLGVEYGTEGRGRERPTGLRFDLDAIERLVDLAEQAQASRRSGWAVGGSEKV